MTTTGHATSRLSLVKIYGLWASISLKIITQFSIRKICKSDLLFQERQVKKWSSWTRARKIDAKKSIYSDLN